MDDREGSECAASLTAAYNPHGAALLAFHRGDSDALLICHQDGKRDDVPAAFWFRDELHPLERLGLDLCKGKVLDVGAGTGLHALDLQRRGLDVTAIDIASECVTIMRERGVENPIAVDLYAFIGGPFDTIICLCNGLDKVGTLDNLPKFLSKMRALLAPGGQLLWTAPPTGRASALESVSDEATTIRRSSSCWQSRQSASTSQSRSFRFMASTRIAGQLKAGTV